MPLDQELNEEKEMSFLDHLEELRWHLIRSLIAVCVFTIGAFLSAKWIFENIVFAPARPEFPTFRALCRLADILGQQIFALLTFPSRFKAVT